MNPIPNRPASDPPNGPEPTLHPWMSGPAVAVLQELLQAHGYNLRVDGDYGYLTEAAVKSFQGRHNLRIDGIIDRKTWAILKSTVEPGTRSLKLGMVGEDVRQLQGLLQVHGYSPPRDGVFGPETERSLKQFQADRRLRADGIAHTMTWLMLRDTKPDPLPKPPKRTRWRLWVNRWW